MKAADVEFQALLARAKVESRAFRHSHQPITGDRYRLPSGRVVLIDRLHGDDATCRFEDNFEEVGFSVGFLVGKCWRLR